MIRRSKRHYCNVICQNKNDKLRGIDKTLKAHASIRKNGQPKLKGKPASWIDSNNELMIRKKISNAKLKDNYMKGRFKNKHHAYLGGKIQYRGWRWNEIKKSIKERDNYKCVECGMSETESIELFNQVLQVDHIIPYRITKDNNDYNLQTLCCKCHGKKFKEEYWLYFRSLHLNNVLTYKSYN